MTSGKRQGDFDVSETSRTVADRAENRESILFVRQEVKKWIISIFRVISL